MHSFIHSYTGWLLFFKVVGSDPWEGQREGPRLLLFLKLHCAEAGLSCSSVKFHNGGEEQEKVLTFLDPADIIYTVDV